VPYLYEERKEHPISLFGIIMFKDQYKGKSRKRKEQLIKAFFFIVAFASISILALIVIFLFMEGLPIFSKVTVKDFIFGRYWYPTSEPPDFGIFPLIIASIAVTAIYLNEYARPGRIVRLLRLGINNLAGVPSVVFGLFGLSLFVVWMGFGVSILSGCLTLAAMILPVIIGTAEEALRAVPNTYREASLGLGATKWQTIYRVVLPAALPGILTGTILGISRVAGETAPIMFTAAVFYTPSLPSSIFDKVMALPYHIYVLATAGTNIQATRHLQYGTALVLIALVLGLNLIAITYRSHLRRKRSGG
jgi:phosphate transport system permease protein